MAGIAMTSPIALQLPPSSATPQGWAFAVENDRWAVRRLRQDAGFIGSGLECLSRFERGCLGIVDGPSRSLELAASLIGPLFVQNSPGLRSVIDVKPAAFLPRNDRYRLVPPYAFMRHGSVLSSDRIELKISGRGARPKTLEVDPVDVVIVPIDKHPRRIVVAKGLAADVDATRAPVGHRTTLRQMAARIDRNLIWPVTHRTHHSNSDAIQCAPSESVAQGHLA